ncbi:transcription factor IBH1-like 1 [Bidens hawaiensis]|uniref:transcription factor IBH1-like 1 n=1 Tax=Bidens hawaiensis TaxID=980011 RepID=UPI0040491DBD
MHTSSMQKKEFLNKWIKGLQICCSSKNKMDVMERKKKIKLSADIAMASVKKPATSWSHALISEAQKNKKDAVLVRKLLGSESQLTLQKSTNRIISVHKRIQCKKILKRSCSTGKRLVKKRTKVLKRLIPGGENMNDILLIKEAMDYILSLKVQVDVMRNVVSAAEVLSDDDKLLKLID